MINKEDLLNEIYRLHRYKEPSILSFIPEFETISLDSVIEKIEESNIEEEHDPGDVMYRTVMNVVSIAEGYKRALSELNREQLELLRLILADDEEVEE